MPRINLESLPERNLEWYLAGSRKKKGRFRNLWMQEVPTGIREKGINNMEERK